MFPLVVKSKRPSFISRPTTPLSLLEPPSKEKKEKKCKIGLSIIHNFFFFLDYETNQYKVTTREFASTRESASPLQQENLPRHKLPTQHEKQCFIIPTQFYIGTQVFRLKLQYQIGANYVKVSTESQKQKQKLKIEEVED